MADFAKWTAADFAVKERKDVRMLLLAVDVWPADTLDEIARLREPSKLFWLLIYVLCFMFCLIWFMFCVLNLVYVLCFWFMFSFIFV